MSSFSLYDHKQYHCGMNKVIPASKLMTFSILHYYQGRHISWTPVFAADENIRAGYSYRAIPRSPMNVESCWHELIQKTREEEEIKP